MNNHVMERQLCHGSGTRDPTVVASMEGFRGLINMLLLRRAGKVVCTNLGLSQALFPNMLPNVLFQVLSRISEIEIFSGLDLLENPLWSMLPMETMLVSMNHAHRQGTCWCLWSVLLPQAVLMPGVHTDVCGRYYHLKPC